MKTGHLERRCLEALSNSAEAEVETIADRMWRTLCNAETINVNYLSARRKN
jgi:hypothetical protein